MIWGRENQIRLIDPLDDLWHRKNRWWKVTETFYDVAYRLEGSIWKSWEWGARSSQVVKSIQFVNVSFWPPPIYHRTTDLLQLSHDAPLSFFFVLEYQNLQRLHARRAPVLLLATDELVISTPRPTTPLRSSYSFKYSEALVGSSFRYNVGYAPRRHQRQRVLATKRTMTHR